MSSDDLKDLSTTPGVPSVPFVSLLSGSPAIYGYSSICFVLITYIYVVDNSDHPSLPDEDSLETEMCQTHM